MSISKSNYNFYLSQPHHNLPSQSLRSFKATQNSETFDEINVFDGHANVINKLGDKDMLYLASVGPDRRLSNVASNALKMLFFTIPAADTVFSGLLKSGNLSSKIHKSASTAGKWAAVFTTVAAVFGVKRFVNSRSEFFDNFNKKHPFVSNVIDLGVIFTAFNALTSSLPVIKEQGKKLFPTLADSIKNRVKAPVKTALNNSLLNKKVILKAEKFFAKRPYLNIISKAASYLFVPAAAIAVFVRFNKEAKLRDEQVAGNYTALKIVNNMIPDEAE